MPRGAKPKVYPQEMVEAVLRLYASGMTQDEVALELGTTQKVIWKLMLRHNIPRRPPIKRDQRGPRNTNWKGDKARYAAMHLRVASVRGQPSKCEHCGTTHAKKFEWASLNKRYEDVNDYIRLCGSCHSKMDGTVRNFMRYLARKRGA